MSKSIKLKNNTYIDSTGVVHNRGLLSTLLNTLSTITNKTNPITLYSNDNGSNGDITLSDSIANYTYIEVYWFTQYNNRVYSNKFYKPNGKDTMFYYLEGADTTSQAITNDTFVFWSGAKFENNKIKKYTTKRGLTSLSGSYSERGDRVYITRVIGYK